MKKEIKKIVSVISLLSLSSISFSDVVRTPYEDGATIAASFQNQEIDGTNQEFNVKYAAEGFSDKMNNKPAKDFSVDIKNKISYTLGYILGESSIRIGYFFYPKPKNIMYNLDIVWQGIYDKQNDIKPTYKLIKIKKLKAIQQSSDLLPKGISNEQYSYSLGYELFNIPKSDINTGYINKNIYLKGIEAGIKGNGKYSLSNDELNAVSYAFGYIVATPSELGNESEYSKNKKEILEGFTNRINGKFTDDEISYSLGYNFIEPMTSKSIISSESNIDKQAFINGIEQGATNKSLELTPEQIKTISLYLGYMTEKSSIENSTLIQPNPNNIKINPRLFIAGAKSKINNEAGEYPPLSEQELRNVYEK